MKDAKKKLTLNKETLKQLTPQQLEQANGASYRFYLPSAPSYSTCTSRCNTYICNG